MRPRVLTWTRQRPVCLGEPPGRPRTGPHRAEARDSLAQLTPHEKACGRHPGRQSTGTSPSPESRGQQPRPSPTATHSHAEPAAPRSGDACRPAPGPRRGATCHSRCGHEMAGGRHSGRKAPGTNPSRESSGQPPRPDSQSRSNSARPAAGASRRGPGYCNSSEREQRCRSQPQSSAAAEGPERPRGR